MAKKKQTSMNIHIVLDRSGSMESCRAQTVSGVNEYLNTIRENKGINAKVSLTLFDSESIDLLWDQKSPEGLTLARDDFVPRGMTPLNDAIGKTITHIDGLGLGKKLVTLVIMTDGLENHSREYTKDAIKAKIKDKETAGWLVIYLGANQDAWAEGAARGTAFANTMSYGTNNTTDVLKSAARATMAYAATGESTSAGFTDDERKRAVR
jgi:Mg-chelatase subunit ChlD